MTFEFTYDSDSEEITIIYDNSITVKSCKEDDEIVYKDFNQIEDDDVESILKELCAHVLAIVL